MVTKHFESIKNKILVPFKLVPKDGLPPEKISLSVSIGILSGLFPVLGMTTLLSLLLTVLLRQNLLIVQSVQVLLGLFQVVLIIPFMQSGAWMLDQPQLQINFDNIKQAFHPGIIAGIKTLGIFHLYGIFSWAMVVIPLSVLAYFIFLQVFRKRAKN